MEYLPGVVATEVPLAAVILDKDAVLDTDEVRLAGACANWAGLLWLCRCLHAAWMKCVHHAVLSVP